MKKPQPKILSPLLLGLLGTVSLLAVILAYTYTHKPFSPAELLNLLIAIWRVLICAAILSLGGGSGHFALKRMNDQSLSTAVIQAALGLGIISPAILLLGAFSLNAWILGSVFVAAYVFLRKDILAWWKSLAACRIYWQAAEGFEKTVAFLSFLILGFSFITALAPPISFDALTYHFAIPKTYLITGRITYLPEIMFWGMPQQTEMLYTLAMRFGGDESAALLGWGIGVLTLAGIFDFTHSKFGIKAAWAAVACLLAGQTISAALAWGYVEWPMMLYGTGMLIAFSDWKEGKKQSRLVLAGIFAGMALTTKYTAGIMLLAGLTIILAEFKGRRPRDVLGDLALFSGAAAAVMAPWLIKNVLATGNPFYPLIFPAGTMDCLRLHFYQTNPVFGSWGEMLLLPWQATVWGIDGKSGYSASIGPLLLGFSLMAWVGWSARSQKEKDAIRLALIIMIVSLALWAIASRMSGLLIQTRLYASLLPAWAFLAGVGFDALSRQQGAGIRFGRVARALAILVLFFNFFQSGIEFLARGDLNVVAGLESREEYLTKNLGPYQAAMQTINTLPPDSKILMLWEPRGYYCLPRCDSDEIIDRWFHDSRRYGSVQAILESWRLEGYTHLLVHRVGAKFIRQAGSRFFIEEDWAKLENLFSALPSPIEIGGSYQLYPLPKDNP